MVRYDLADGSKQYRPIHRSKDGWRVGDPSGKLPLYRLLELKARPDEPVYICEGEKAVDTAGSIGLLATTSAHGAGAASKADWTPLAGRDVVVLPDHDEAGEKYATEVTRMVLRLEPPARVKIVHLPGLPDKGDIVEYLDARDSVEPETIREGIEALATNTPTVDATALIGGPVIVNLSDVEPREVDWLWPNRIAVGRITLLVGRPGCGKSFLTTDVAARVTTGSPWPDESGNAPKGSVILISAEDDPADTIRPRLDAHYADVRRVHLLTAVMRTDDDGKPHEAMFTLNDVAALEEALKRHRPKLVVVDPIGSFMGSKTDAHRDNEVRGVLAPLARLVGWTSASCDCVPVHEVEPLLRELLELTRNRWPKGWWCDGKKAC